LVIVYFKLVTEGGQLFGLPVLAACHISFVFFTRATVLIGE